MEQEQAKNLEEHLKRWSLLANVISVVSALFVAMGVGYGFYYSTKSTLKQNTEDISHVKETMETLEIHLNDIDVFKGVSTVEVKALESKVDKNLKEIEKMDEKLDKILMQTR